MSDKLCTFTGRVYPAAQLTVEAVDVMDIAVALSRIPRFGGHTRVPYSVADHSIRVSQQVPDDYALEALLHDAHEAYTGFGDVQRPAKQGTLGTVLNDVEINADVVICRAVGASYARMRSPVVAAADAELLATELRDLMPPAALEAAGPLPASPLPDRIKPRGMHNAARDFLRRYEECKKLAAMARARAAGQRAALGI